MSKKQKGINPELEDVINRLLKEVMNDSQASLTDKAKILDRALKLEALKQKADLDEWGSGFFSGDEDDEK